MKLKKIDKLNLYRQLLKGAKKFPSVKRDGIYNDIKYG